MIEIQDIPLSEGKVVTLANGVILSASPISGSRPSAITVRTESGEIEIADFVEGRYNSEVNRSVPTCEIVIWRDKAFIVGLPSAVIAGGGVPLRFDLFRKAGEDTGFYKTEWLEAAQRLLLIYESGIAAWNEGGQVLWHTRKAWDDVFTGSEAEGLKLTRHDGQRITIDPSDGSEKPPRDCSPS